MNKRQEKKLFKQTLIKVRKLHPKKGDVICLQPDLDWVDIETMSNFIDFYKDNKVFNEADLVIVPADIKKLKNKEEIKKLIDKLQSIVDQMGK